MEEARTYEELRVGFTAAVSHELRTPLARLLALLDSATLPDADQDGLIAQAVNSVTASRALYFSSAGNSGNVDDGTAGTWDQRETLAGLIPRDSQMTR